MEAGSALVVPGSAIDGEAPGSDDDEAASPRVRLTQARLLDGRLQNQTVEDGSVTEELGNLMVNDAFDMLIRKVHLNSAKILFFQFNGCYFRMMRATMIHCEIWTLR